jgi:CRP-like cAMP-binding protein
VPRTWSTQTIANGIVTSSRRPSGKVDRVEPSRLAVIPLLAGLGDSDLEALAAASLGPGDVFGEVAVVASGPRRATVTATSPMSLIALFKRDVWALERRAPDVVERLRSLIAEQQPSAAN